MKSKRVLLKDYAERYVTRVDGSTGYAHQFHWACHAVEKELGRAVYVDEITVELVNSLIAKWKSRLSTHTLRSRRNMLVRIAKVAARDERLAKRPPLPIRDELDQVKRRTVLPFAWTPEQVAHLVETIRKRDDVLLVSMRPIAGIDAPPGTPWVRTKDYWESFVLASWDSGLRVCDLIAMKRTDIDANGRVALVQQKTNKPIMVSFRPATVEAIERSFELSPKRVLIWPVWTTRRPWNRMRARILRKAGLSGRMSMLRASAGTAAEVAQPGTGPAFLGNTPAVFFAHYFDRRHVKDVPQPPELPLNDREDYEQRP